MDYTYSPEEIAAALQRPAPTPEQSAIISSPLAPRLVVAGAGSGKTATMVDRVVFLVANGLVQADQVLGVTFTRKAAGELRERMRMRLEELRGLGMLTETAQRGTGAAVPVSDPVVSTYHSYANTLVANYGLRLGIEQDAQMLGEAQSWQLVAQLVEHVDPRLLPPEPQSKQTMISGVLKLAAECAEHLVQPRELIDWCLHRVDELEGLRLVGRNRGGDRDKLCVRLQNRIFYGRLVQMYTDLKKSMQVMDYGDLMVLAARIAREISQAGEAERDRYRVVLLDEFQDTSHAQMQLFSDLFGAGSGESEYPVMAVGDPKQSIYGFRGASDGQLFSFYDYFPATDREASYLTVAWRNDTAVLEAANAVAAPLKEQPDWMRSTVSVKIPDLSARPQPRRGRVLVGRYHTDADEAAALAQQISAERQKFESGPQKAMPTMAVLCKKRIQMAPIARELEQRGVPYQIVGLGGLLDTPEVVDMVAILRVLADPGRSDALMRLLAGARWRLGVSDLLAFSDWARHLERRRSESIRRGIREDLYAQMTEEETREQLQRLQRETAFDSVDSASLVEALEELPKPGWVSVHGRSLTDEGLARLRSLAAELDELRQFMADDLSTLLYAIEQKIMLDIELAARPGVSADTARRNIDAFHEAAATYSLSAPRINAVLLAGAHLLGAEQSDEPVVRFSLTSTGGSASSVNGFLTWLEAAAEQEAGLAMTADEPSHALVQILTLHASKGLEWDCVYIPGMNRGDFPLTDDPRWTQNSDTLPWPLRGDRNYLPAWRSDFEDVQELKEALETVKEEAAEHRMAEERRLAYVGFTRARRLLVLTGSVWQRTRTKPAVASQFWEELRAQPSVEELYVHPEEAVEKENPQSAAITTALWPFDPIDGPKVFEWASIEELNSAHDRGFFNDPDSSEKTDESCRLESSRRARLERAAANVLRGGLNPQTAVDREGERKKSAGLPEGARKFGDNLPSVDDWYQEAELLLSILRSPVGGQKFEFPSHMTASDLVNLAGDIDAVVDRMIRPMPQKPTIAARQGDIFHSWVESRFEQAAMLDFAEEDYADQDLEQELDLPRLKKNFLSSRWANVQPWAVEYPIETPLGAVSVRGRIDAVYRSVDRAGEETWELVDWKTGRSPRNEAEGRQRSIQLALYRLGFARLQNISVEKVKATFYYVAENKEWSPQNLADEKQLQRLIQRTMRVAKNR